MGRKRKTLESSEPPPSSIQTKQRQKPKPIPVVESESEDEDQSESPSSSSSSQQQSEFEHSDSSSSPSSSSSSSDADNNEASKREAIKTLLEPFGKDQLIQIIKEAAAQNPSLLKSVDLDPIHRKIFVHGLSWETTTEALSAFFSQYGPVEECKVVADKASGRSKGYAFLLFSTRAAARKALLDPRKRIGGRITSCQLASAGPVPVPGSDAGRKLYVASVGPQLNPGRLRDFFASFGEIEQGPLGLDKGTGKFRGFTMFVYKTAEGLRKALEEPDKVFEGFKLQCSVAVAKGSKGSASAEATSVTNNAGMPALPVLNPGALLMGQNPAFGVLNPVMGMGYSPAFGPGVSSSLNMKVGSAPGVGGFGLQSGVSGTSPSLIGGYGAQPALQGYGSYQNAQMGGQPSASAVGVRPQHGAAAAGAMPSYFGL